MKKLILGLSILSISCQANLEDFSKGLKASFGTFWAAIIHHDDKASCTKQRIECSMEYIQYLVGLDTLTLSQQKTIYFFDENIAALKKIIYPLSKRMHGDFIKSAVLLIERGEDLLEYVDIELIRAMLNRHTPYCTFTLKPKYVKCHTTEKAIKDSKKYIKCLVASDTLTFDQKKDIHFFNQMIIDYNEMDSHTCSPRQMAITEAIYKGKPLPIDPNKELLKNIDLQEIENEIIASLSDGELIVKAPIDDSTFSENLKLLQERAAAHKKMRLQQLNKIS